MIGRGGGDPQDDAVAVLDLKGAGLAGRAVWDRYPEGAAIQGMTGIDDGDSEDRFLLAVRAAWGIKKIPRSTLSPSWSGNTCAMTPCRGTSSSFAIAGATESSCSTGTPTDT